MHINLKKYNPYRFSIVSSIKNKKILKTDRKPKIFFEIMLLAVLKPLSVAGTAKIQKSRRGLTVTMHRKVYI